MQSWPHDYEIIDEWRKEIIFSAAKSWENQLNLNDQKQRAGTETRSSESRIHMSECVVAKAHMETIKIKNANLFTIFFSSVILGHRYFASSPAAS